MRPPRRAGRIAAILLVITVEVPDRCVGIEVAAVMEFDALPQVEDPFGLVFFVLLPSFGKSWADIGKLVGLRQVPQDEPFEHRKAEKAHPLIAVVGSAGRDRNVGGRHRDPQRAAGECCWARRKQTRRQHSRKSALGNFRCSIGASPTGLLGPIFRIGSKWRANRQANPGEARVHWRRRVMRAAGFKG